MCTWSPSGTPFAAAANVMGRALGATPLKKVTPQLIKARLDDPRRREAARGAARILRHRSLDTTMRIYAHLFAEDLRPVMNLLPAVPPPVETSASARVALRTAGGNRRAGVPGETPEDSGPSDGARYWIRTSGLRLRRPTLYPSELIAQISNLLDDLPLLHPGYAVCVL